MDDQLAALAGSAATTVVNALATDTWQRARDGIARLWARYHPAPPEDGPDPELPAAGSEESVTAQVREWEERFRALLEAHPEAAQALAGLVAELGGGQPEATGSTDPTDPDGSIDPTGSTGSAGPASTHTEMHAEAKDSAQVFQAGNNITNIRYP
jgi:hypothetical protein